MPRTKAILGIVIDDFGILAAELRHAPDQGAVVRGGRFRFESPLAADNAVELGREFGRFLKDNHIHCRRAVVGIPARWTAARDITLPPISGEALAGVLQIQAERAFTWNTAELVYDICGRPSPSQTSQVLLLATRRPLLDRTRQLLEAAGLKVQSITVSSLALAAVEDLAPDENRCGFWIRPGYCEFWNCTAGRLTALRHVPLALNGQPAQERAQRLAAEYERFAVLSGAGRAADRMTLYDASSAVDDTAAALRGRLSHRTQVDVGWTENSAHPAVPDDTDRDLELLPAAALALQEPPVDFLRSRTRGRTLANRRKVLGWAAFGAAVVLIGLAAVLVDWRSNVAEIARYRQQLQEMDADIASARLFIDRVDVASTWTTDRPRFLDCLRQLTLAFPEEGTIWATNLGLQENPEDHLAQGLLIGKTVDEAGVVRLLDTIKQNPAFSAVQMVYMRDAGRDSREMSFAVNFKFQPEK